MVVDRESARRRREPGPSEQQLAIERREGNLLLAAGAGSGKTSVLVERFVASVVRDGIGVGEILTITFTEKAAAEMRDRIRSRLRELGEDEAAAATEGAYIATIHGFCARVLRAQALSAGLDPGFVVLDEHEAAALAGAAFEDALERLAASGAEAIDMIAGYGRRGPARRDPLRVTPSCARAASWHPALPPLAPAPELAPALRRAAAARPLRRSPSWPRCRSPGVRVIQALERLQRCLEHRRRRGSVAGCARRARAARRQRRRAEHRRYAPPTPMRWMRFVTICAHGARAARTGCSTSCCAPTAATTPRASVPARGSTSRTSSC